MQSVDWIKLLRLVPPELVDNVTLITVLGIEISVQTIIQMDEQYIVLRGRMSGTNDDGKSFIVPYDQLCFLGFTRPVPEAALLRMLNSAPGAAPALAPAPVVEVKAVPVEEVRKEDTEAPVPVQAEASSPGSPKNPTPTKKPNMAALLDRIRARSQQPNGQPPAPAQ